MDYDKLWAEELEILKSVISKTGLIRTIKWGGDVYTLNGQNVVGLGSFKSHFAVWFYNGVFLCDPHKVLINAQAGKTKALRQWRFTSRAEIDEKLLTDYLLEAIENEKQGRRWTPETTGMDVLPQILQNAIEKNHELHVAFNRLTPYKQKEYIAYLTSAKRDQTRTERLEKIIPAILKGIGLNDKYRSA